MSPSSTSPKRTTDGGTVPESEVVGGIPRHTSETAEGEPAPTPEEVISLTAWRPGFAIRAALRHDLATVNLPLVGPVTLPGFAHLTWYGGVAALVALEIVEPPVAALMVVAKALVDSRHHEMLRSLGEVVESGV